MQAGMQVHLGNLTEIHEFIISRAAYLPVIPTEVTAAFVSATAGIGMTQELTPEREAQIKPAVLALHLAVQASPPPAVAIDRHAVADIASELADKADNLARVLRSMLTVKTIEDIRDMTQLAQMMDEGYPFGDNQQGVFDMLFRYYCRSVPEGNAQRNTREAAAARNIADSLRTYARQLAVIPEDKAHILVIPCHLIVEVLLGILQRRYGVSE